MKSLAFHLRWALRELALHRGRTLVTMTGVALAISAVLCVLGFFRGYEDALGRSIDSLGFEVLVTAKGCPYEAATLVLSGGNIPMYIDEAVVARIAARPEVLRHTRLFMQSATDQAAGRTYVFLGVERSFLDMKPWLGFQQGEWFGAEYGAEAILGYNVASALEKEVGDELTVPGIDSPLKVVGLLDRTGSQDDGAVLLPLAFARKAFDKMGKLTGVGVKLKNGGDLAALDRFIDEVQAMPSVQVITLAQVRGTLLNLMGAARVLMAAVGAFGLLVAVAAVVNSVLSSVVQRMRELSILKAMGAAAGRLFLVICLESVLLCAGGALLGFVLAVALSSAVESGLRAVLPYVPDGDVVVLDVRSFWQAALAGVALGLFACLGPAWKAARARPALGMRP